MNRSEALLAASKRRRRTASEARATDQASLTAEADSMDRPAEAGQKAGLSDYLAAERTLLAWIRTGLALMGFGFVVARFGLFLEALQIGQPNLPLRSIGLSPWFGTVLLLLGIIVNVWSARSHIRLVRELKRGQATRPHTT